MSISILLSAGIKELPVRTIDGNDYYIYKVEPGDGLYSISRKLGVTIHEIEKTNPEALKGIKVGQELRFLKGKGATASQPAEYKAKKGDTVYGISRQFNISQSDFIDLNPSAKNGIKEGYIYKISGNAKKASDKYIVKSGDTLYAIAKEKGCTVSDITELNPGILEDRLEIGQEINIPAEPKTVAQKVSSAFGGESGREPLSRETLPPIPDEENIAETIISEASSPENEATGEVKNEVSRLNVALILSFMANSDGKSKEAKASANFYRGFMLAVDSLKDESVPMTIMAYDWEQSPEKLNEILANPELRKANVIIAPDDQKAMERITRYGRQNDINVFNIFSTKDTTYQSYPNLFQANIPYDKMVEKAIGYLENSVGTATVVILRPRANVDKIEITDMLAKRLKAAGVPVLEISFSENLTVDDLKGLSDDKDYIFIPTTAKATPSTEMLATLAQFNESRTGFGTIRVYGYPEWTLLKGKAFENMRSLGTTIYSRFYNDNSEDSESKVEESHKRWFGSELPAGIPKMTLTGFDTARFLMKSFPINNGDFNSYSPSFDGDQTPIHFIKTSDDGGWYNDSMYIITYRPSGFNEKLTL